MECLQPEGPGPLWEWRWQWHASLAQDRSDQVQMRYRIEHTRQEVQTRMKFEVVEQRGQDEWVQVLEEGLAPEEASAQCGRGCVDNVRRKGHEEFLFLFLFLFLGRGGGREWVVRSSTAVFVHKANGET